VAPDKDAARLFSRARRLGDVPIVEPRIIQTDNGWEIVP